MNYVIEYSQSYTQWNIKSFVIPGIGKLWKTKDNLRQVTIWLQRLIFNYPRYWLFFFRPTYIKWSMYITSKIYLTCNKRNKRSGQYFSLENKSIIYIDYCQWIWLVSFYTVFIHHCQWRAVTFSPMLSDYDHWTGIYVHCVTLALAWGLGFFPVSFEWPPI